MIGLGKGHHALVYQSDPKLIVTRFSRSLLRSRDFVRIDVLCLNVVLTFVVIRLVRLVIRFVPTETAQVCTELGIAEQNKGEFQKALSLFTQGIDVKCKDDTLNTFLYFFRWHTHYCLGESVICFPL